ncbi:MAG: carbohydrate ABC transporter permease, partial [Clostridiales bacterium]|nr:carbohydrate ABC transporter permease [Clostridiales bacterium]
IMLIIPALATPMTVFFMRMYLKATFSREIVESARLDGAGEFRIFNQIMLPLMKPAIATQTIFCFVASWTDEWVPRIILIDTKKDIFTLPLAGSYQGGALLMFLPPIILYIFLSKHIVEGIALGSVKA